MLDSTGYDELSARFPFMVHMVWQPDEEKLASIFEHGLERTYSNYEPHWASRPGHVYLATPRYAAHAGHLEGIREGAPKALKIDTSKLEPQRINPDEDHFLPFNVLDLGSSNRIGAQHALQRFHHPFPPTQWTREWTDYMRWPPLPSLGEWAEQCDLGRDPAEARYSLAKGSIAYNGVIPPEAIVC